MIKDRPLSLATAERIAELERDNDRLGTECDRLHRTVIPEIQDTVRLFAVEVERLKAENKELRRQLDGLHKMLQEAYESIETIKDEAQGVLCLLTGPGGRQDG